MSRLQPISTPTSTPFPYTTLFRSFDAWKAESPTNGAAYARAEAAWRLFDDPPGDAVMDAMRASALAIRLPARRGLWTGMGVGLAASLLLAVAIGTDTLSFGPKVEAPQIAAKSAPAATPKAPASGEFVTMKGDRKSTRLNSSH